MFKVKYAPDNVMKNLNNSIMQLNLILIFAGIIKIANSMVTLAHLM